MIRTTIAAGSRDGKLYIFAAAALICAAVFPLYSVAICLRNWGLLCMFLIISFHDAEIRIIPNRCILALLLLAVFSQSLENLGNHLLSVILIGGLLLLAEGLLRLFQIFALQIWNPVRKDHFHFLGGGDVKLLLVVGLFLSLEQTFCMLLLAGFFGLFSALTSFLRKENSFPFGPGICSAAAISILL